MRTGTSRRVRVERFALTDPFRIARGAKREAVVVTVTLSEPGAAGRRVGRGESLPYARFGETPESVARAVRAYDGPLEREALRAAMPPGPARSALDLALWDLEARRTSSPAWRLAGLPTPAPVRIAQTLVLDSVAATRRAAATAPAGALLKLKLGGRDGQDLARVAAAREGSPTARLIVDANEGWDAASLARLARPLHALGVELIEQPLPAAQDAALRGYDGPVPLCADESARGGAAAVAGLADRYQAVNVKLDKTGGLTEALDVLAAARRAGLRVMLGTMVASSLAVAPAVLLAARADWADLDGARFLARDRRRALRYEGDRVHPPTPALWGG